MLQLLDVLASKLRLCQEPLDAQAVGNALFGLQSFSSDKKEVLQLVSVLVLKVQSCQEPLSAQAVGNALFGLSSFDLPDCRALAGKFVLRMINIGISKSYPLSHISALISGADALLQSSLYGNAPWASELESLRGELTTHLQLHDCEVSSSRIEAATIGVAQKLFSQSLWQANANVPEDLQGLQVLVDSNIWLQGYEADIVLRISGEHLGMKLDVVVNVEVDGPCHDSLKSQRHSKIRDWRMRRQGVHVERWKVELLNAPNQVERLLIELVRKVAVASSAIVGKNLSVDNEAPRI